MCGKYTDSFLNNINNIGSPPHVREVPKVEWKELRKFRITPACAGSTKLLLICANRFEDHPRMCGKYYFLFFSFSHLLGSPPHVREVLTFSR